MSTQLFKSRQREIIRLSLESYLYEKTEGTEENWGNRKTQFIFNCGNILYTLITKLGFKRHKQALSSIYNEQRKI